MIQIKDKLKALGISAGLFISYSAIAICKEQLFKYKYDDEKFVFPISLAALQFVANAVSAKVIMIIDKHPENETPQKFFVITSVFNVLTMTTSNMALQYVPYVALVVGKACKPIPVMIFTALIARKFYTIQRYIFVCLIAVGVGLFVYKDGMTSSNENFIGNILIFTSLFLEGFLGASQAKMRISSKPSSMNYMLYVNVWCIFLIFPLLFIDFEGMRFVEFCLKHTEVVAYVSAVTITGTIGHYFVSAMVSNFGPLPLSLVSTTRKFFTVLLSSLIFGNVLSWRQWMATVIIFEALILDVLFGRNNSKNVKVDNKNEPIKTIQTDLESAKEGCKKIDEVAVEAKNDK